jgi:hypothetical protein
MSGLACCAGLERFEPLAGGPGGKHNLQGEAED